MDRIKYYYEEERDVSCSSVVQSPFHVHPSIRRRLPPSPVLLPTLSYAAIPPDNRHQHPPVSWELCSRSETEVSKVWPLPNVAAIDYTARNAFFISTRYYRSPSTSRTVVLIGLEMEGRWRKELCAWRRNERGNLRNRSVNHREQVEKRMLRATEKNTRYTSWSKLCRYSKTCAIISFGFSLSSEKVPIYMRFRKLVELRVVIEG